VWSLSPDQKSIGTSISTESCSSVPNGFSTSAFFLTSQGLLPHSLDFDPTWILPASALRSSRRHRKKKSSLNKPGRLENDTTDAFQDTVEDDESEYEGGWLIGCSFGATMPYEVEVGYCVPTTDCDRATCNKL